MISIFKTKLSVAQITEKAAALESRIQQAQAELEAARSELAAALASGEPDAAIRSKIVAADAVVGSAGQARALLAGELERAQAAEDLAALSKDEKEFAAIVKRIQTAGEKAAQARQAALAAVQELTAIQAEAADSARRLGVKRGLSFEYPDFSGAVRYVQDHIEGRRFNLQRIVEGRPAPEPEPRYQGAIVDGKPASVFHAEEQAKREAAKQRDEEAAEARKAGGEMFGDGVGRAAGRVNAVS